MVKFVCCIIEQAIRRRQNGWALVHSYMVSREFMKGSIKAFVCQQNCSIIMGATCRAGISHVIFVFCTSTVVQNVEITWEFSGLVHGSEAITAEPCLSPTQLTRGGKNSSTLMLW